jgi:hypothetical protein
MDVVTGQDGRVTHHEISGLPDLSGEELEERLSKDLASYVLYRQFATTERPCQELKTLQRRCTFAERLRAARRHGPRPRRARPSMLRRQCRRSSRLIVTCALMGRRLVVSCRCAAFRPA